MSFGKGRAGFLAALLLWAIPTSAGQGVQVSGQVIVTPASGAARDNRDASVVFWLTPLTGRAALQTTSHDESPHPRLIQKSKIFDPHVLAVQVGSLVDFPNRDPFFHNVFSLFNGRRFDLGLYEAGSTRSVRFDRAGTCYIFCNIHPQMSAVVVVVDTPYFAVSNSRGEVSIPNVLPGLYQLNLWEEHCLPKTLNELSRQVTVGEEATPLGSIRLQETNAPVTAHLDKYGKRYDPEVFSSPLYIQP
jgi:plastocyanin